jgi:hypothetical protein
MQLIKILLLLTFAAWCFTCNTKRQNNVKAVQICTFSSERIYCECETWILLNYQSDTIETKNVKLIGQKAESFVNLQQSISDTIFIYLYE